MSSMAIRVAIRLWWSTRRCLVMACRVSLEPPVNREIEQGGPTESLATSDSRVASPRAAKTGA
jgi:hypothetical protein